MKNKDFSVFVKISFIVFLLIGAVSVSNVQARRVITTTIAYHQDSFLKNHGAIPLELSGIEANQELSISKNWPALNDIQSFPLSDEAKTLLTLPYYVDTLFQNTDKVQNIDEVKRKAVGLVYSIAYLRQFSEITNQGDIPTRKTILAEIKKIAPNVATFLEDNLNKELDPESGAARLRAQRNTWRGKEPEETELKAIETFLGREFTPEQIQKIAKIIHTRDRIVNRSRALKIGEEALAAQDMEGTYDPQILEQMSNNTDLMQVVFGLRDAAIIDTLDNVDKIQKVLWTMRQLEGPIINVLKLPDADGRYYVYDEYSLRKKAFTQNIDINLIATKTGLEHLIKKDITHQNEESIFYLAAHQKTDPTLSGLIPKLSSPILKAGQQFTYFDPLKKIYRASALAGQVIELEKLTPDAVYIATMNRPDALNSQLEVELENYRIFNHYAPIVIIDNTKDPKDLNKPQLLTQNKTHINALRKDFPEASITHSAIGADMPETGDLVRIYAEALAKKYETILNSNNSQFSTSDGINTAIMNILKTEIKIIKKGENGEKTIRNTPIVKEENGRYKIDIEAMETYLKENMFKHISGVRNHMFLMALAHGDVIVMNMDDDAPPETYMGIAEKRAEIDSGRIDAQKKQMNELIETAGEIDPRIKNEKTLYQHWNDDDVRFRKLEQKYFSFSQNGNTGLIAQSTQEIQKLADYFLEKAKKAGLEITPLRYQSLMNLAEYMIRVSDFFYTDNEGYKERGTKEKDNQVPFTILPVNTFSQTAFLGKTVGETNLPLSKSDMRGILEIPGESDDFVDNLQSILEDTIIYVAYPFVGDQDTSGRAQAIQYVYRDINEDFSMVNLQHTHRSAFLNEGVMGFASDTYIIFNRGMFSIAIPFPSIGRELRLEEPPYVKWIIAQAMEGEVTSMFSIVAGAQIRKIGERIYVISGQDFKEVVGGTARYFYESAIKRYNTAYDDSANNLQGPGKEMERLQALGKAFTETANIMDELAGIVQNLAANNKLDLNDSNGLKNTIIKAYDEKATDEKAVDKNDFIEFTEQFIKDIQGLRTDRESVVRFLSELGRKRGEKSVILEKNRSNLSLKDIKKLEQEIRDMDLVLTQYANDFFLYHIDKNKIGNTENYYYRSNNENEDYFYKIWIANGKLYWQKVKPELKVEDINGVKKATESKWIPLTGGNVSGSVKIERDSNGRIKIEDGRYIVMDKLPQFGKRVIVPALVDKFEIGGKINRKYREGYLDAVLNLARGSIRSDGETLILWPDVVDLLKDPALIKKIWPQK